MLDIGDVDFWGAEVWTSVVSCEQRMEELTQARSAHVSCCNLEALVGLPMPLDASSAAVPRKVL